MRHHELDEEAAPPTLKSLSEMAALLLRGGLSESRGYVLSAQGLVDDIRTKAVVQNGTKESLRTLSAKLGEAEEMYAKVFSLITKDYGDDPAVVMDTDFASVAHGIIDG